MPEVGVSLKVNPQIYNSFDYSYRLAYLYATCKDYPFIYTVSRQY